MTITIADRSAVPEAVGLPDTLTFKTASLAEDAIRTVSIDAPEGIIVAIVSVTGVVDEVDDIIVPGAYAETLAKRRPKVCWAHSWEHPIGRVLYIEELLPGDSRLPDLTRDGKPWPKEAGALVASMQFNLRTDEGRNAFEAARFYSESGECEYSIGYQVPPGKSASKGGIRYIKMLELYELSVVLFGAHTMTGTLSIKAATAAMAKALPTTQTCKFGDEKADRRVIWADGRAYIPTCSEHEAEARRVIEEENDDEVVRVDVIEEKRHRGVDLSALSLAIKAPFKPKPKGDDEENSNPFAKKDEEGSEGDDAEDPEGDDEDGADDADTEEKDGSESHPDFTDGIMVAIYPDPAAADQVVDHISGPDATTPRDELHVTLAYLGKIGDPGIMTEEQVVDAVTRAIEGQKPLDGIIGGIGMFPEGDHGAPTYAPVDIPGLSLLREQITHELHGAEDGGHGFTPHMTLGYDIGVIEPLPPIPVSITEVRVVYGSSSRSIPLGNATPESKSSEGGADRNEGGAEDLRHYWTNGAGAVKIAWGTPGDFTRCVAFLSEHMTPEQAKGYCANRHKEVTGMWPGDKDNQTDGKEMKMDEKAYPQMPGSFEERMRAIRTAIEGQYEDFVRSDGSLRYWIEIRGTWENRVLYSVCDWSESSESAKDYMVDYEVVDASTVLLTGEPEEVELSISVDPVAKEAAPDFALGDSLPLAGDLMLIASAFKAAHVATEGKGGRVLSGANERDLRNAFQHLVDVLAAAGIELGDVTPDKSRGQTNTGGGSSDERIPVDPAVDTETTSPTAVTKGHPASGENVAFDIAAHRELMASIESITATD